jgi:hypothetical protein
LEEEEVMEAQDEWGPDDEVDAETAARMLDVAPDRIDVLVADGLLDPVPGRAERVFAVSAVAAVRQQGG